MDRLSQHLESPIMLAVHGSYLYGLETPTSDRDYRGLVIAPPEYYFGVGRFDQADLGMDQICALKKKNRLDIPIDADIVLYDIRKIARHAIDGQTQFIELFFIPKEKILIDSVPAQLLVSRRHLFLSKRIFKKFSGYAMSEWKVALGLSKQGKMGQRRKSLIQQFGYSPPNASHCLRLFEECKQLLLTQEIRFPLENTDYLMAVKKGEVPLKDLEHMYQEKNEEVVKAYEKTALPNVPKIQEINDLLVFTILMNMQFEKEDKKDEIEEFFNGNGH